MASNERNFSDWGKAAANSKEIVCGFLAVGEWHATCINLHRADPDAAHQRVLDCFRIVCTVPAM